MYKLAIKSTTDITLSQKKAYLDALFPEEETYIADKKLNQGFLNKFAKAIGFKPVMYQYNNVGMVFTPTVDSPEDYTPPHYYLRNNLVNPIEGNEIASFYVENEDIVHTEEKYSYNSVDLLKKAQNYFQKVFPDLVVELTEGEEKPVKTFVEFFSECAYRNMNKRGYSFVEVSTNKLMTEEEIQHILDTMKQISNAPLTIEQYECETCYENTDGKSGVHVEMDYDREAKYKSKEKIEAGI